MPLIIALLQPKKTGSMKQKWSCQAMVAALSEKIYNMDHVFGESGHSDDHGGAILPEMLQCKHGPIPKEAKQ